MKKQKISKISLNYAKLATLAIKADVSEDKINSAKQLLPEEIELGTCCDAYLTELSWYYL